MNCLLIEMGEMACYQERCPQCGRIPPGRKAPPGKKPKPAVFKKLVGRKLSGKKSVKTNGSLDMKTDKVTNQNGNYIPIQQNGKSYVTNKNGKSYVTNHNGDRYFPKAVPSRWQIQEDSIV